MTKVVWEGAPSLRRLLVPIAEAVPHPENARHGNLDAIEESLKAFGQMRPIVLNTESGYIVAGNHVYRTAVERLGWNRIAVVKHAFSKADEYRYLLADNRTSDLGSYDVAALSELIAGLAVEELVGTGYDQEDVERMMAEVREAAEALPPPEKPDPRKPISGQRSFTIDLTAARHEKFGRYLTMLEREMETDGPSETVYRVVEQAAKNL